MLIREKKNGLARSPEPKEIFNAPYLFVLSTGRCGTALLTKILDNSPKLLVYHNPSPILEYTSSYIHRNKPSQDALKLSFIAARFEFLLKAFTLNKIFVETNNRITFFAPAIADLCPNARFIHLIRHPADFVRSGMRRGYYDENIMQYQRLYPENDIHWSQMSRLEKISWEWNEINSAIEDFKSHCDPNRILTIKSEELFNDIDTLDAIYDFIDINNPFTRLSVKKIQKKFLSKPVNKQATGSFPKYKDWPEKDKESLRNYAPLAFKYNYKL